LNDDDEIHQCPKCQYLVVESEMIECIDAKTDSLLAYLCRDCVKEWIEFEKTLPEVEE
jgi:hypothetical protein